MAASLIRPFLLGHGPLFKIPPHDTLPLEALLSSGGAGLLAGLMALGLTLAVYAWEDLFLRLPIHWMWWPAIGGVVVAAEHSPRAASGTRGDARVSARSERRAAGSAAAAR
ncbi:MAG TPA: chloride channel protein [Gemmataceae bacterium]|nr:chloride channel protein [Gemmataceae bacterium]